VAQAASAAAFRNAAEAVDRLQAQSASVMKADQERLQKIEVRLRQPCGCCSLQSPKKERKKERKKEGKKR